jgi:hypothetical protein
VVVCKSAIKLDLRVLLNAVPFDIFIVALPILLLALYHALLLSNTSRRLVVIAHSPKVESFIITVLVFVGAVDVIPFVTLLFLRWSKFWFPP